MKRGKGGKGTSDLKAGVSNKDADFALRGGYYLLFLFSIFKNRGFIPCGEKFFIPTLSPSPFPLLSKLFPYLWETVISNLDELHSFFQNWGVK
jgi:hypothetical protein